ncbi:MAG: hypothetical protein KME54_03085 [Tolypothrix brevis GSE-NOS-MK-07-07A]|jgi:hypothetical protein|nr:hypothetical protein [Tolypothrix brevis GSE-NOS-MK-07-07A]
MIVTAKYIKNLIQAAKDAGADPAQIQELQEELSEIESGKLLSRANTTFSYEKTESDGTKVICVSTAPFSPEDDDDFEGVTLKPVKGFLRPKP